VERPVADHAAFAEIKVEHRGESQVDPTGTQLAGQHIAAGRGRVGGGHGATALTALAVVEPHVAQTTHGRHVCEAVGLEALHASTLMVHADQDVGAQVLDLRAQGGELHAADPVAGEQDEPASQRMLQAAPVIGIEAQAFDVQHHGRVDDVVVGGGLDGMGQ